LWTIRHRILQSPVNVSRENVQLLEVEGFAASSSLPGRSYSRTTLNAVTARINFCSHLSCFANDEAFADGLVTIREVSCPVAEVTIISK
jgi:hypothetical protein